MASRYDRPDMVLAGSHRTQPVLPFSRASAHAPPQWVVRSGLLHGIRYTASQCRHAADTLRRHVIVVTATCTHLCRSSVHVSLVLSSQRRRATNKRRLSIARVICSSEHDETAFVVRSPVGLCSRLLEDLLLGVASPLARQHTRTLTHAHVSARHWATMSHEGHACGAMRQFG